MDHSHQRLVVLIVSVRAEISWSIRSCDRYPEEALPDNAFCGMTRRAAAGGDWSMEHTAQIKPGIPALAAGTLSRDSHPMAADPWQLPLGPVKRATEIVQRYSLAIVILKIVRGTDNATTIWAQSVVLIAGAFRRSSESPPATISPRRYAHHRACLGKRSVAHFVVAEDKPAVGGHE